MPYIAPNMRPKVDKEIEALAAAIVTNSKEFEDFNVAGILNYAISTLVTKVIKKKFGSLRYSTGIALITGVLANVKDEFYRRVAVPYEDKQKSMSGDVFGELLA